MIKKIEKTVFWFLLCVLSSCSTIQKDLIYTSSAKTDNIRAAEEIEKALVKQGGLGDRAGLEKIKKDLDALLSSPSSDSGYLAFVYALYGPFGRRSFLGC